MHRSMDPAIDADHDRIIIRFAEMKDVALAAEFGEYDLLDELQSYLSDHFNREEQLMRAAEFPGLAQHRRAHRATRNVFDSIRRNRGISGINEVLPVMRNLFLGHILTWDEAFAEWLAARSSREDSRSHSVPPGTSCSVDSDRSCATSPPVGSRKGEDPPDLVPRLRILHLPGPGDHPVADLLFHGRHPFPADVERLILRLHQLNPCAWRELSSAAASWTHLPDSGSSCGRILEYLHGLLRDLEQRSGRCH